MVNGWAITDCTFLFVCISDMTEFLFDESNVKRLLLPALDSLTGSNIDGDCAAYVTFSVVCLGLNTLNFVSYSKLTVFMGTFPMFYVF